MDLGEKEKLAMENRSEENPLSFHGYMADSFRPRLWDPPASSQSLPSFSEASRGSPIAWNSSGFLPSARPQFPDDPGFIERAARFSSFSGFFPNSFCASDPLGMYKSEGNGGETSQSGGGASLENPAGEPELSGGAPPPPSSEKAVNGPAKKRKRGSLDPETDQMRAEAQLSGETSIDNADGKQRSEAKNSSSPASKHGGKNAMDAGGEAPKEDYIHVRARRGQATNSHSLAERLRREKISERMKFLQDLVPGCSKVTGKAVMLDEIINYVQSLQRQVEFLSMKLATVNPRLDFNIESLLSKEMLQSRGISASSFEFGPEMGHHPQMHPQQGLIHSGIPGLANPSDIHRRSMSSQLASNQMSGVWDEELHHVLQMGFGGSAPLGVQDLHGFSPLGQMKSEP